MLQCAGSGAHIHSAGPSGALARRDGHGTTDLARGGARGDVDGTTLRRGVADAEGHRAGFDAAAGRHDHGASRAGRRVAGGEGRRARAMSCSSGRGHNVAAEAASAGARCDAHGTTDTGVGVTADDGNVATSRHVITANGSATTHRHRAATLITSATSHVDSAATSGLRGATSHACDATHTGGRPTSREHSVGTRTRRGIASVEAQLAGRSTGARSHHHITRHAGVGVGRGDADTATGTTSRRGARGDGDRPTICATRRGACAGRDRHTATSDVTAAGTQGHTTCGSRGGVPTGKIQGTGGRTRAAGRDTHVAGASRGVGRDKAGSATAGRAITRRNSHGATGTGAGGATLNGNTSATMGGCAAIACATGH